MALLYLNCIHCFNYQTPLALGTILASLSEDFIENLFEFGDKLWCTKEKLIE
jgi:hypothetical protein